MVRRTTVGIGREWVISTGDLSRIKQAGRIAGGLTGAAAGLTVLSAGVLLRQAQVARRVIPLAEAPPPRGDGLYGPKFPGRPVTMALLGDSTAAGYGVHRPRETPGALLATGISRRLRRPVRLHRLAVVGSTSAGLSFQVDAALECQPDLAVIFVGGNDVTHGTAHQPAVRHLADAVRRLRAAGARVVVGTCPDLGAIQPIKPPLRWLARRWSRQLAAAQTVAVVEAGGRTVSISDLLGPAFEADPVRMFASDRFHPSAEGYARAAAVMMPTLLAALGEDDRPPVATGPEGVRSLPQAAHEAVRAAGTEVSPARVDGRDRGPAGRWAQLRRHPWFGEPRSLFGRPAATLFGRPAATLFGQRSAALRGRPSAPLFARPSTALFGRPSAALSGRARAARPGRPSPVLFGHRPVARSGQPPAASFGTPAGGPATRGPETASGVAGRSAPGAVGWEPAADLPKVGTDVEAAADPPGTAE